MVILFLKLADIVFCISAKEISSVWDKMSVHPGEAMW